MADQRWERKAASDADRLIIHIEPIFYFTGAINFSRGWVDLTLKMPGTGAYYSYNMFIYITKGDYIRAGTSASSFQRIYELAHIYPHGWGADKLYDYNLRTGFKINVQFDTSPSYNSGDKYYINMLCQVHPSEWFPDNQWTWCDIAMDGKTWDTWNTDLKNEGYNRSLPLFNNADHTSYLKASSAGGSNPGGGAAFSKWDPTNGSVNPYSQYQSLMPGYDEQFDELYTAVAFPVAPDAKTYAGGSLVLDLNRSSNYTSITATAIYTNNGAPYFYGVQDTDSAGSNRGKIKIVLYDSSSTTVSTQYVTPSANGKIYTASYIFNNLTDSEKYFVAAYVVEDRGDNYSLLEANDYRDGKEIINYTKGSVKITASRTINKISAKGTYTKGSETGKTPASKYWGSKTTGGTASANKSKVLLILKNSSGTELESAVVANKTQYVFDTDAEDSKEYSVEIHVVEMLDQKTKIDPATATVPALGSIGTVSAHVTNRTDNTATLQASYNPGGLPYYATLNRTDKKKLYYFLRVYEGDPDNYASEKDKYVDSYGTWVQRKKLACNDSYEGANWNVEGLDPFTNYEFTAYAFYFPTDEMTPMYRAYASCLVPATQHGSVDPTDIDATITGTTVTLTPAFADNGGTDVTEVEWTARLGKVTRSGRATKDGSGNWTSEPAKFDLLANATTYTIVFHGLFSGATEHPAPSSSGGEEGEEGSTITPSAGYIDLLNTDVYYDAMTYGVTVLESEKTRTTFTGIAYQTIGAHGETNHAMTECGKKGYAGFCRRRDGTHVSSENIGAVSFNNGPTTVSTETVGSSAGSTNFNGSEVKVTGLQPSTGYRLYVYLTNCKDFEGKYDAVGYIDFTTEAVAIPGLFQARVTGTSITVTPNIIRWNNSSSLEINTSFSTVAGVDESGRAVRGALIDNGPSLVTPSNLMQTICYELETGTKYLVEFTCEDDEGNEIEIEPIEVVTYGIVIDMEEAIEHTRTCEKCMIKYIEGERMSNTPQDTTRGAAVCWFITEAADSNNIVIDPSYINCRRSNPYYLTTSPPVLKPGNSYTLSVYIEGVLFDGLPDTLTSVQFQCVDTAYYLSGETKATGTTILFTPTWIDSPSPGNVVTVIAGLYKEGIFIEQKQSIYKDIPILFTGLERGQYYTIVYTAKDNEGNTSADYITYNPMYTGVIDELTYKLLFSVFETTTRSLFTIVESNRPDLPDYTMVDYYIAQGSNILMNFGDRRVNPTSAIFYYHLIHNAPVEFGARFTTLKDQNDDYDTTEYATATTKKLTLEYQGYEASPHALATEWHAQADGKTFITDQFSNYPVRFEYDKIVIVPVKRGEIGDDYGNYTIHRGFPETNPAIKTYIPLYKRYFDKLTAGRSYRITMWITDGVNEASAEGIATTLVPTVRIYSTKDNKWHKAMPYIVHNSYWYAAPAHIYTDGRFLETNPTDSSTPDDDLFMHPELGDIRLIPDYYPDDISDPVGDEEINHTTSPEEPGDTEETIGSLIATLSEYNTDKVSGRVIYHIGSFDDNPISVYYANKSESNWIDERRNKILMELYVDGVLTESALVIPNTNHIFDYIIPDDLNVVVSLICYVEEVISTENSRFIRSNTDTLYFNNSSVIDPGDEPETPVEEELGISILNVERYNYGRSLKATVKYTGPSTYTYYADAQPTSDETKNKIADIVTNSAQYMDDPNYWVNIEMIVDETTGMVTSIYSPIEMTELYFNDENNLNKYLSSNLVANIVAENTIEYDFGELLDPYIPYELNARVFYSENDMLVDDSNVNYMIDRKYIPIYDYNYSLPSNYVRREIYFVVISNAANCAIDANCNFVDYNARIIYPYDYDEHEDLLGMFSVDTQYVIPKDEMKDSTLTYGINVYPAKPSQEFYDALAEINSRYDIHITTSEYARTAGLIIDIYEGDIDRNPYNSYYLGSFTISYNASFYSTDNDRVYRYKELFNGEFNYDKFKPGTIYSFVGWGMEIFEDGTAYPVRVVDTFHYSVFAYGQKLIDYTSNAPYKWYNPDYLVGYYNNTTVNTLYSNLKVSGRFWFYIPWIYSIRDLISSTDRDLLDRYQPIASRHNKIRIALRKDSSFEHNFYDENGDNIIPPLDEKIIDNGSNTIFKNIFNYLPYNIYIYGEVYSFQINNITLLMHGAKGRYYYMTKNIFIKPSEHYDLYYDKYDHISSTAPVSGVIRYDPYIEKRDDSYYAKINAAYTPYGEWGRDTDYFNTYERRTNNRYQPEGYSISDFRPAYSYYGSKENTAEAIDIYNNPRETIYFELYDINGNLIESTTVPNDNRIYEFNTELSIDQLYYTKAFISEDLNNIIDINPTFELNVIDSWVYGLIPEDPIKMNIESSISELTDDPRYNIEISFRVYFTGNTEPMNLAQYFFLGTPESRIHAEIQSKSISNPDEERYWNTIGSYNIINNTNTTDKFNLYNHDFRIIAWVYNVIDNDIVDKIFIRYEAKDRLDYTIIEEPTIDEEP